MKKSKEAALAAAFIFQDHSKAVLTFRSGRKLRRQGKCTADLCKKLAVRRFGQERIYGSRSGGALVDGIHRVKPQLIDVILHNTLHQIGYILVVRDIPPDPGGAHIFKVSGKLQPEDFRLARN